MDDIVNDSLEGALDAPTTPTSSAYGPLDRLLRRRLHHLLDGLRGCELRIEDALGASRHGEASADLRATLHVHDPAFYRAVAASGSIGAGEAFADGRWDCDDLVALVRALVVNRDRLDALDAGSARLAGWLLRGWEALRRNTRRGARRNIAAHYDLGNALFETFLDPTLTYSSALFAHPDESLEIAQRRKLDRICRKLELSPTTRVMEIGTGWGGFAIHAAREYGCRVTTTTISPEQHALASRRVQEAGLADRVTLLSADYRDLQGRFDRVVSIEMVEAIGHQYLDTYFAKITELLAPDGLALVQAITIEDHRYEQALRSVDFIKRHVFPGSFMPCISAMLAATARVTDLRLIDLEDIGPSYALTLRHWRQRFLAQRKAVRALGYPERFVRLWEFYLAYCEGGFLERSVGNAQMLFARPRARRASWLPDIDRP